MVKIIEFSWLVYSGLYAVIMWIINNRKKNELAKLRTDFCKNLGGPTALVFITVHFIFAFIMGVNFYIKYLQDGHILELNKNIKAYNDINIELDKKLINLGLEISNLNNKNDKNEKIIEQLKKDYKAKEAKEEELEKKIELIQSENTKLKGENKILPKEKREYQGKYNSSIIDENGFFTISVSTVASKNYLNGIINVDNKNYEMKNARVGKSWVSEKYQFTLIELDTKAKTYKFLVIEK